MIHLQDLVGKRLWASGRVVDLQWFQFGMRITVPSRKGTKVVGEFALHIQCAWRIRQGVRIIVASRDRYSPAEEDVEQDGFDWDRQGANLCDRRMSELFQNEVRSFAVEALELRAAGDFTLSLAEGYALDVFVDDSEGGEHWRLFKPGTQEEHLVFPPEQE